jgi:hypothetical protein
VTTGGEEQGQAPPTPEELAAALADRLARTPVRDVLLQSMATFIDMAGIRLGLGPTGGEARDLVQARQAIEALRALLGVAERELGSAQVHPFKEPLAVLQMAYARAAEAPEQGDAPGGGEPPAGGAGEGRPPAGGPGPAGPDPASRLWVPPGTPRPGR